MTKGRKTTQQERVQIVAFCLEHGKDYLLTVEQFGVSYQQIYSWVRKYEEKDIDGLADTRGRTKPEREMTETEKLQAQVRMLEAQLRDKEMETLLLKSEGAGRRCLVGEVREEPAYLAIQYYHDIRKYPIS